MAKHDGASCGASAESACGVCCRVVTGLECATVIPWPADDRGHNAAGELACEHTALVDTNDKRRHNTHVRALVCDVAFTSCWCGSRACRPWRNPSRTCA
jgi:hypothetical protein